MHRKLHALLTISSVIALTACSRTDDPAARGAEIMEQARAAAGGDGWNEIRILHERGQGVSASGETFEYEHWGDLQTLSVRNDQPGRPNFMVFDGHAAYQCADAECVSPTVLPLQGVRTGAYLTSYGYFFPDRFAASFEYRGARDEGGARYDVVQVKAEGIDPIELWVDQGTHRVARMVYENGQMRTDLSDYRQVGPVWVPFVARDSGMTINTIAVRFDPADAGEIAFTPPAR